MVRPLGGNDALDFERWFGEVVAGSSHGGLRGYPPNQLAAPGADDGDHALNDLLRRR